MQFLEPWRHLSWLSCISTYSNERLTLNRHSHWAISPDTFMLILFRTLRVVHVKIWHNPFKPPANNLDHAYSTFTCTGSTSIEYTTQLTSLSWLFKNYNILRETSLPPERFIKPAVHTFLNPSATRSWRYTEVHLLVGKVELNRCCSYWMWGREVRTKSYYDDLKLKGDCDLFM